VTMKKYLMMALAMLGLVSANGCKANKNVETLSPQEFQQRLTKDSTALLIDVRKPDEYAAGHLQGATLMNWLDRKMFEEEAAKLDKGKTLYVYCRSGRRSGEAANYLGGLGFKVVDMQGGYFAWTKAGLDVTVYDTDTFTTEKGRKVAITFIKHGTLMIQVDGYTIHIDPVRMFGTDYLKLPKADLLLVTHEHNDHYDFAAIKEVSKDGTRMTIDIALVKGGGKVVVEPDNVVKVLFPLLKSACRMLRKSFHCSSMPEVCGTTTGADCAGISDCASMGAAVSLSFPLSLAAALRLSKGKSSSLISLRMSSKSGRSLIIMNGCA